MNKIPNQKLLNLGCGTRYHSDWQNVNFTSSEPGVIAANLNEGIPFSDNSFDVIYHSHLLEHFSKTDAPKFLQECFRVMKPSGVIRVVVPDLETIIHEYLVALEKLRSAKTTGQQDYEWILLEMYDQVTRNYSGGEMANYLFQERITNEGFVIGRCGVEVKKLIEIGRKNVSTNQCPPSNKKSFIRKLIQFFPRPHGIREYILAVLLGNEYQALQVGRFRMSGENHQWMYDSYSLSKLLENAGFTNIIVRSAKESYIPGWTSFNLDTEPDSSIYKPDSLYIEAVKP